MRFNGVTVSMPNGLYIFGGGYSAQLSDTFEYLPPGSNVWKLGSTQIPKGFTHGCAVRISDHELVLIGGRGEYLLFKYLTNKGMNAKGNPEVRPFFHFPIPRGIEFSTPRQQNCFNDKIASK